MNRVERLTTTRNVSGIEYHAVTTAGDSIPITLTKYNALSATMENAFPVWLEEDYDMVKDLEGQG